MGLEELDVRHLIEEWQTIRDLMTPSTELFSGYYESDHQVAEISVMSGRRKNWTAYVGLMGYAEQTKASPNIILSSIQDTMQGRYLPEADSFLQYCSAITSTPRELIAPATYSIKLIQGDSPLVNTPKTMNILDHCLRLFPNNPEAVLRCLKGQK
jgi:hypothetical protein